LDFLADPADVAIHTVLSPAPHNAQTHILYDARFKPEKAYISTHPPRKLPDDIASAAATMPAVPKLRLVAKECPWAITVKNPEGVTVTDCLEAVYTALDQPMTEGEWWIAQDEERAKILETYKHNCSDAAGTPKKRKLEEGVKRIDYLGERTLVVGLTKDDGLIKARFPDKKEQAEALVLLLHKA
jgi:hypothetical protein